MFRFLHAADVHLDSPLRGLDRYEGAPVAEVRAATRRAFGALVETAIAERVAFVVLAGDLYDGDWRDYGTGMFFAAECTKLRDAGIAVFLAAGNHDAESVLTKHLPRADNVRIFPTKAPDTFRIDDLGVALHGQGFGRKAVPDDLTAAYPPAIRGLLNIGVLHTSLDGREGHASYAPTSADALRRRGYDYWALGHVHAREVVSRDPWIVFPGNVQGRHVRESGDKGASLVTVEGDRITDVTHRAFDVLRWNHVRIDATVCANEDDVLEATRRAFAAAIVESDGRSVAARVTIVAHRGQHARLLADPARLAAQVRTTGTDASSGRLWVEKVRTETSTIAPGGASAEAVSDLVRELTDARDDADERAALAETLATFVRELPPEVTEGAGLDLDPLLAEARAHLASRLAAEGGAA